MFEVILRAVNDKCFFLRSADSGSIQFRNDFPDIVFFRPDIHLIRRNGKTENRTVLIDHIDHDRLFFGDLRKDRFHGRRNVVV